MKVLVAMDSMKGSISSRDAATAVRNGILSALPEAQVDWLPVADGGEGTVETLVSGLGGERITLQVTGPLGAPVAASYGWLPEQEVSVFEMAEAAGLPLVPPEQRDPRHTTTRGVGEMLLDALDRGYRRMIIGIGGSATNDCGIGMLEALGCRFLDGAGAPVGGYGQDVAQIRSLDLSGLDPRLASCEIQVACDVNNPLWGPNGASAVFGPQKGATPEIVRQMDDGARRFSEIVKDATGIDAADMPGAGAAGGLGYALLVFLHAKMASGISIILDMVGFDHLAGQADVVVTGEGRLDRQTVMGKVPAGVAEAAKRHGTLVVALAGCVTPEARACNHCGIDAYFPILQRPCTEQEAMDLSQTAANLESTAAQVFRLIAACGWPADILTKQNLE